MCIYVHIHINRFVYRHAYIHKHRNARIHLCTYLHMYLYRYGIKHIHLHTITFITLKCVTYVYTRIHKDQRCTCPSRDIPPLSLSPSPSSPSPKSGAHRAASPSSLSRIQSYKSSRVESKLFHRINCEHHTEQVLSRDRSVCIYYQQAHGILLCIEFGSGVGSDTTCVRTLLR